ncbi:MAG TPA: cysteine dioxygenase, partial [Burkholderiales bacterium]
MDRAGERRKAIDAAVADIRDIERRAGVNRASLEKIKARLIKLAARTDLFDPKDYPPPAPGQKLRSCLYRISEDADHRFALYANASLGGYGTPAHNHTTWAVIVGVTGEELNKFYDRDPTSGVREKGRDVVK